MVSQTIGIFTIFICSVSVGIVSHGRTVNSLPPVVLVPGDGGSQFEAKLNKTEHVHIYCKLFTQKWYPLWLNLELLVPYVLDCFVDNMKLIYNATTRCTYNSPGVYTRQPGFGNTTSVEWLDKSQISATSYFNPIVASLVKDLHYRRGINIRGAPYDFRKAPNEMSVYIEKLKALIVDTYEINNGQKVVLIGHSMGNPYILYLLNKQTQAWKNKYIRSFISLAGPWGGAAKIMRLMASGDNLGVFVVNPLTARVEQRSMPSSAWLMPSDKFWSDKEPLVIAPKRNYTVKDYEQFFKDIKFSDGWNMRKDTRHINYDLTPPGVEVHCVHGIKVKTPLQFKYSEKQWPDDQPSVVYGDGDGTVNRRSLYGCLRWRPKDNTSPKVYHKEIANVDHMEILGNEDAIKYIKSVLTS